MKQVVIEGVSCICDHVISLVPESSLVSVDRSHKNYTIEDLTIVTSCGSESLMKISYSTLSLKGTNTFFKNYGTIIIMKSYIVQRQNTAVSFSNSTSGESILYLVDTTYVMFENTSLHFANNVGEQCGGITLIRSDMILNGKMSFTGNKGHRGGAIALYDKSDLETIGADNVTVLFSSNTAQFGGAIFISDAGYQRKDKSRIIQSCILLGFNEKEFISNTATIAGNAVYGGWLDYFCRRIGCGVTEVTESHDGDVCSSSSQYYTTTLVQLQNTPEDTSVISSNPSRICLCSNAIPLCNITQYTHKQSLFPGQTLNIQAVAVGQRFGTVPSTVIAEFINSSVTIDEIQHVQFVGRLCTGLSYTIKSPNSKETLRLTVERNLVPEPDHTAFQNISYYQEQLLVFEQLTITLSMTKCPLGYSFDNTSNICACQETLTEHDIECYIQNRTVVRRNQMWINATFIHITDDNPGVIVHHNCPYDYCKVLNLHVQYLDLQHPDDQCAFRRSGILCGGCPQNLSQVFGTSRCKECSNVWSVLIVSVFILTGIGLVALLIILDLTVSIGTINGLIFYAHIVRVNQAAFFPPQMTNTFLSWFIAWLNLDLGIEMCFFDGLNAYTKTWLQFLFPIYIWVLVIIIIVSSHYSTFAARLSGTNAVQVLATLFLMSYAKMLRITITAFSFTTLTYPDGHPRRVWLYDGNVDYLKGKHIPLFVSALFLLLFLSFPYTLVLFFIQWLRLLPSYRVLFWVRRFMPLFDAYTGVYKRQHGYWTGLLLLVRVALFLVFSFNFLGDPSINLLATAATIFLLFMYLAIFGGVYRYRHLNVIEYSFLANLGILSAVTVYTRLVENIQVKIIKTSGGIAVSTFIVTAFCHAYIRLKSTKRGGVLLRNLETKLRSIFSSLLQKFKTTPAANLLSDKLSTASARQKPEPTHSSIQLREPLLVG